MPVLGAAVADSYLGKYKTMVIGLSVSVVGMAIVTTSATLPSLRPPPCAQNTFCAPATLVQKLVFFSGIYLCAVGIGVVKAVFIAFAAEQIDDDDKKGENASEREAKASYFSWYYAVANVAMLTAGTLLVWVQDKVSWGLGYGICGCFVTVAAIVLAATAPMYRILPPVGSPWTGALQVLFAFSRKLNLTVPDDAIQLYQGGCVKNPVRARLQHTDQFRCLDKAAIVTDEDLGQDGNRPWRLCTVTQVEEVKTLLRLIPIWLTSAVYFVANTQAQTTFVQQGTKTADSQIPAASLTSVETVCVAVCLTLYNRAVAMPALRRLAPLQLMGLGHATAAVAMAVAACTEARRLRMAGDHQLMGIAWLLPQYVVMAVSDASLSVGQMEFFYSQSPETMRGASMAFCFLAVSFGNLINSQLVTLLAFVTSAGGRTGWFPPELNKGHLDYYFLFVVAVTLMNFSVFVALARNYTPKRVR
ncbi:hypothetical protein QYE76_046043 [Lolium multiflorum]|uniref:Uncharacterized protein n=1 Tax=Lolium multiflorum TaxID=4521 RepID=A0AAD8TM91_LOLMU|nr:hypothetical protein QYE76_046043 [Lolium multiflorum]